MEIEIFEHHSCKISHLQNEEIDFCIDKDLYEKFRSIKPRLFPSKTDRRLCYKIDAFEEIMHLQADYYVGIDWLIEGERFFNVKPKLNNQVLRLFEDNINKEELEENQEEIAFLKDVVKKDIPTELNYLRLLVDALSHPDIINQTSDLVVIDWTMRSIPIKQQDDMLTPFLIIQFLNTLKHIVKKGLKKSYYRVRENLNNMIKGKIIVSSHIRNNVLKSRFTKTYCEYQEFGVNDLENQFLKKVLKLASNYINANRATFERIITDVSQLISYCYPAFELVSDDLEEVHLKQVKFNPFFKEYKEAIKIGQYILKRFSYNITNTAIQEIKTPPFWIDMPKLFELYVYHHLLTFFKPGDIKFQFSTYGNKLDFLITSEGNEMVIDAKYKMHYQSKHIHDDIRQVSGYARLNKVYNELKKGSSSDLITCLIVYPNNSQLSNEYRFNPDSMTEISAYKKVYKIGIPMPYLTSINNASLQTTNRPQNR